MLTDQLKRVSQNCLHGHRPPDDLRKIWQACKGQPWTDFVAFTLVDTLDGDFFEYYRDDDDRVPAQVITAYRKMFSHIAFVGKLDGGELFGYWLGPENRSPADSPIVELDTEGQFGLLGRNLAEYLLIRTNSDNDFTHLRRILNRLGLKVEAETQDELFETFLFEKDFGDPNTISWRYQKGLEAPRPSIIRFGDYKFHEAKNILSKLGIDNLTADSNQKAVIQRLGAPDKIGGGIKVVILGYINPFIVYHRPECQLRFEFDRDKGIKMVTLLEPDWEPGM